MDALNAVDSRKHTPIASMQRLEQAIILADQRSRIRRDVTARATLSLAIGVFVPFSLYFLYNLLHANGVMHNHKSSSGNYMYWAQHFMYTFKPQTQVWRPEFYNKESQTTLFLYSQKIKKIQRGEQEGAVTLGVHHPNQWH